MDGRFKPRMEVKQDKGNVLKVIPLGGIGDVTKNMYVYEYGNDIVVVDCGIGFPDETMLGVDLVIPDITYLKDKIKKIRGVVITHAHDDHIGGLPYLWPDLECPIFAQKLAAGFIRHKFSEMRLPKDRIQVLTSNSRLQLGVFNISFYQVSHSVPDTVGVIMDTPVGKVIHQADFKLDWTPVNNQVTEVGKIAVASEKGVLLLLIDALRVERSGYTLSERTIQPTFQRIANEAEGRIFITTTSSNITRIQQALNVAVSTGRKVALVGRSMESNFQVARDLGYIMVPPGLVIASDEVGRFAKNKLMLIIAGSQGQPGSALSRVANGDHRFLSITTEDTVIFSADPIPSAESAQHALIDKLTQLGATVYYTDLTDALHVSGHASAEELKVMINLVKPRYLLPIGATFRQMKAFANMVKEMGWGKDRVLLVENGQVVECSKDKVVVNGRVEVRNVYVDGLGVGDVGNVVLRDRRVLAEEGIVLVVIPVDTRTGKLAAEPDIISRGFIFGKEAEELLGKAKRVAEAALADHPSTVLDWRFIRRHIEESLDEFFYKELQRHPMILPIVVEI